MAEKGAIFVDELSEVPDGNVVIFSAHGVSPAVRSEAELRGLKILDATCPLVTKVHLEAKKYAGDGFTIILVGRVGASDGVLGGDFSVVLESEVHNAAKIITIVSCNLKPFPAVTRNLFMIKFCWK